MNRGKAARIGVGRVDVAAVRHQRRKRERLAAAARAEVDHDFAGLSPRDERG